MNKLYASNGAVADASDVVDFKSVNKVSAVTVALILLYIFGPPVARAQIIYPVATKNPDTAKVAAPALSPQKKRFGRAALFLGISELTPWAYDRYVAKFDYAKVSFHSIAHNLNPANLEFDQDIFVTNQFGHPYQGSYFFNSFRTNGYSFWQSAPAAFAGSFIWEAAGENGNPSPNDFINTGFGGAVLGEMEYRFSNKVINNRATGFKRQVSEVAGFILSPLNGLNRIIDGKWGKVAPNSEVNDSSKVTLQFDLGARRIGNFSSKNAGVYGHVGLIYGSPEEDISTPFSNIAVNAEFGKDDSTKVNIVSIYGSLAGWELKSTEKQAQLILLSANYDFIRNQQFFYGGQSVKANWFSEYDLNSKWKINTLIGAGPVLLGAVPDKYGFNGRDYDYESGVAYSARASLSFANRFFYEINYRGSWLGTINGHSSHSTFNAFTTELSYMFIKGLSLAAEPGYFHLKSYFINYPDVDRNYPYVRFSARYTMTL